VLDLLALPGAEPTRRTDLGTGRGADLIPRRAVVAELGRLDQLLAGDARTGALSSGFVVVDLDM